MNQQPEPTLRFALPFTSRAVLQADQELNIWGFAPPNQKVEFACNDEQQTTQSDDTGRWQVRVSALPAGTQVTLSVTCNSAQVTSTDLIAGDLFLCAGQSNMEWTLNQIDGTADRDAMTSDAVRFVRCQHNFSRDPQVDMVGNWRFAHGDDAMACSAIGFYVAHQLHAQTGRPIGFIVNAVGGSMIETWMPQKTVMELDEGQRRAERMITNHRTYFNSMRDHMPAIEAWMDQTGSDLTTIGPGVSYDKMPAFPQAMGCNAIAVCWNALMAPLAGLSLRGCFGIRANPMRIFLKIMPSCFAPSSLPGVSTLDKRIYHFIGCNLPDGCPRIFAATSKQVISTVDSPA